MKEKIEMMFNARLEQVEKHIEENKAKGFFTKFSQGGRKNIRQIVWEQCYEELKSMKELILECA